MIRENLMGIVGIDSSPSPFNLGLNGIGLVRFMKISYGCKKK